MGDVVVPTPSTGQALIHMIASSVNPSDVDIIEMGASGGRTLGNDMSGYVVSCNNCTRLKAGDFVWGETVKLSQTLWYTTKRRLAKSLFCWIPSRRELFLRWVSPASSHSRGQGRPGTRRTSLWSSRVGLVAQASLAFSLQRRSVPRLWSPRPAVRTWTS